MGKRLRIERLDLSNTTGEWRAFSASEGEWFQMEIHHHGSTDRPITVDDVVGHAVRAGREELLERLRRKADQGRAIRIDRELVPCEELRRCLEKFDDPTGPE